MKNKNFICSLLLLLSICCVPINVNAQTETTANPTHTETNISNYSINDGSTSYAYDIRWLYKIENGITYRRLYNYTLNKWVGDWERVN